MFSLTMGAWLLTRLRLRSRYDVAPRLMRTEEPALGVEAKMSSSNVQEGFINEGVAVKGSKVSKANQNWDEETAKSVGWIKESIPSSEF